MSWCSVEFVIGAAGPHTTTSVATCHGGADQHHIDTLRRGGKEAWKAVCGKIYNPPDWNCFLTFPSKLGARNKIPASPCVYYRFGAHEMNHPVTIHHSFRRSHKRPVRARAQSVARAPGRWASWPPLPSYSATAAASVVATCRTHYNFPSPSVGAAAKQRSDRLRRLRLDRR